MLFHPMKSEFQKIGDIYTKLHCECFVQKSSLLKLITKFTNISNEFSPSKQILKSKQISH